MKISLLFFSILSGMSVALIALMPLVSYRKISRGFFRFNAILGLILILPFLPFNPYGGFQLPFQKGEILTSANLLGSAYFLFVTFTIFLISLIFIFSRKKKPINKIIYIGSIIWGLSALLLDSLLYRPFQGQIWWENILIPLNFISSAALLGSALFAMLLGHWYLIQFDLDKALLKRVSLFFCLALGFRFLSIALNLFVYWKANIFDATLLPSLISLAGHGIFFWMRILVGLFLPAILAWMIYETAKMGANQSCTGLLYIAVVLIFMGEMLSRYVFFLKGIPL